MFNFGIRLQQLRFKNNLSQYALGQLLDRSKSVICAYENNARIPPLKVLLQIATIFNVSVDYLVGIEKKEMISIDELDSNQQEIINALVKEFKMGKTEHQGLTNNQQSILSKILQEFCNR